MQILPLFAVMQDPEPLIWFVFSTIAFLLLAGGVLRFSRTAASRLIAVGILLAITSVGYGGFASRDMAPGNVPVASAGYGGFVTQPAAILLSTGLMKIALILVLSGVACVVISSFGGSPAADAAKSKEPPNER